LEPVMLFINGHPAPVIQSLGISEVNSNNLYVFQ